MHEWPCSNKVEREDQHPRLPLDLHPHAVVHVCSHSQSQKPGGVEVCHTKKSVGDDGLMVLYQMEVCRTATVGFENGSAWLIPKSELIVNPSFFSHTNRDILR